MALKMLWLCVWTLLASVFSEMTFHNMLGHALARRGLVWDTVTRIQMCALLGTVLVHGCCAVIVAATCSVAASVVVISYAALIWGFFAYFLKQRFAGPMDKPFILRDAPLLLPLVNVCSFLSSVLATVLFVRWYLAFAPVIVWVVVGFLSAEISIRSTMRDFGEPDLDTGSSHTRSRSTAMMMINSYQGRGSMLDLLCPPRYPFP